MEYVLHLWEFTQTLNSIVSISPPLFLTDIIQQRQLVDFAIHNFLTVTNSTGEPCRVIVENRTVIEIMTDANGVETREVHRHYPDDPYYFHYCLNQAGQDLPFAHKDFIYSTQYLGRLGRFGERELFSPLVIIFTIRLTFKKYY